MKHTLTLPCVVLLAACGGGSDNSQTPISTSSATTASDSATPPTTINTTVSTATDTVSTTPDTTKTETTQTPPKETTQTPPKETTPTEAVKPQPPVVPNATDNVAAYVKFNTDGACGAALIAPNMIVTADHCIGSWRTNKVSLGNIFYGKGFAKMMSVFEDKENVAWQSIAGVDLTVIKLKNKVDISQKDVTYTKLPNVCTSTQANAFAGRTDVYSYHRMLSSGVSYKLSEYRAELLTISSAGSSPAANGVYYKVNRVMNAGDSGGAWITKDNVFFGINNATYSTNAYGASICYYVNQVVAAAKSLDPAVELYYQ